MPQKAKQGQKQKQVRVCASRPSRKRSERPHPRLNPHAKSDLPPLNRPGDSFLQFRQGRAYCSLSSTSTGGCIVGEWSEYFEDFPEENPANWVNGRLLDPRAAAEYHARSALAEQTRAQAQAQLDGTIKRMIDEGNQRAKAGK